MSKKVVYLTQGRADSTGPYNYETDPLSGVATFPLWAVGFQMKP